MFCTVLQLIADLHTTAHANDQSNTITIHDGDSFESKSIESLLFYQHDPLGRETISTILQSHQNSWWQDQDSNGHLGATNGDVYWAMFTVESQATKTLSLILEYTTLMQRLDFFLISDGILQKTASVLPTGKNEMSPPHHYAMFEFDLETETKKRVIVRLESGFASFPLRLWTKQSFLERQADSRMIIAAVVAAMTIMLIYNMIISILVPNPSSIFYLAYLVPVFYWSLYFTGGWVYITPEGWGWLFNKQMAGFGLGVGGVSSVQFARSLLATKKRWPSMDKTLIGLMLVFGAWTIASIFTVRIWGFISNTLFVPWVGLLLTVGIHASIQRYRSGYFYTAGWTCVFLGTFLVVLDNFGVIQMPGKSIVPIVAIIIEMLVLSVAVSDKIRMNQVQSNRRLKTLLDDRAHSYDQMKKVFYPHQISSIKNGVPIEETMPVGSQEACVLSFDIVNSSKIKHGRFQEYLESFMVQCRELMMSSYNEDSLHSRAYMIKEVGDGFLCSLGFPFKAPHGNPCGEAVRLAEDIMTIFTETLASKLTTNQIYCGIGIAKGPVQGYFSRSGVVRYDLWGKALVQATRYEGMRKQFIRQKAIDNSSTIILQREVYEMLDPSLQNVYSFILLESMNLKVRDDPDAKALAYRKFDMFKDDPSVVA